MQFAFAGAVLINNSEHSKEGNLIRMGFSYLPPALSH
jgi:hypothetical protein